MYGVKRDKRKIQKNTQLHRINSSILEKIEPKYLDTELKLIEINNICSTIQYNSQTKIILCPVSDKSFKNYYRSIYSSKLDNCYWGLKSGNNEKQWVKLKIDDYILLYRKINDYTW